MQLQVFVIFDSKAEIYTQPFCFGNKNMAVRAFSGDCRQPGHNFHRFAEDFSLFWLGSWNEETAQYDLFDVPECIARAHELKGGHDG